MNDQRKLAAVMFTDIVGYTALMSKDEQKAMALLKENRELQQSLTKKHNGEFLKEMGDGTLLCFQSALDAVRCAMEIQQSVKDDSDLNLRIGIHLGDIVFKEGDVFGDGVNVASRIERLAKKGGVYLSENVYQSVRNQPEIRAEFIGEKTLKNVDHSVKIYSLSFESGKSTKPGFYHQGKSETRVKSIIVLPFINMSPDPEQEYFSDGLTEEIITDLSHINDLLVISRSSAMTFKGTNKKIKEIAKEVNVKYVLEGGVRKAGNNLRITSQLIYAETDAHLWAEKYTGTLDDVFYIQEKVSRSIVDALKVKISPEEIKKLAEHPIDNIQALECYQRAQYEIYRFSEESVGQAVRILNHGLELVGENAMLYAGLGQAYYNYYDHGWRYSDETLDKVKEYADKVMELEPKSPHGYMLMGLLERSRGSHKKACKYFTLCLDEQPQNTSALMMGSWYYACFMGQLTTAQVLVDRLFEIDPLSPINYLMLFGVKCMSGDFKGAIGVLDKAYQIEPNFFRWGYVWIANMNVMDMNRDEALKVIDKAINDDPDDLVSTILTFLKYVLLSDQEKALGSVTEELKTYAWNDSEVPWFMTQYYSMLDEKEESLNWLERAVDRGWINYPLFTEVDPLLENIRGEDRFKKLMERVKHEWDNFEV